MNIPYYLKIGRASELKEPKERKIFRALEILPGAFSWFTLILVIVLSWLKPFYMAVFIICFTAYWFFRVIYFSFHLNASYKQMRKNERTDWIKKISQLKPDEYSLPVKRWQDIYHLVILPMYKEPIEVVETAFQSLLRSDWPKQRMLVVLTYEEKGGEKARKVGQAIEKKFKNKFFKLLVTSHPQNLPDEIIGKGSNDAWGARQAKQKIIDPLKIPYENIIVSSFDTDTNVFPRYFSCLAYYYLTTRDCLYSSFQPIPFFINNIWQAPPISRIFAFSASFWEMMCQERPEKLITFSSHSMSFKALVDVDFRQKNIVSDDSRIFWQCFLKYNGNYKVIPLYYPISMDANVAENFLRTMKNIYKQQQRWAYGVADIPYFLFGFYKNKKIPFSKKLSLGFTVFETHWSWATSSIIIFLLGWLPIVLGGEAFRQTLFSYNLPIFVRNILTLTMVGLISSAYFSIVLLPPKPPQLGKRKYLFLALEWFLLPAIMMFFTALPSLDAQTRLMLGKYMGFWTTPKTRKSK